MKQTQRQRVISRLMDKGKITRNECLNNYITRLSAIILVLKQEGWEFETKEEKGDYVYYAKCTPIS